VLGIKSAVISRIIVSTLVTGGVYALLASGFSLIFGMAHIINLAQTAFYMVAAYGMYIFTLQLGLGVIESIVITLVGVTLLGILSYKLFIDRIREHVVAVLLVTIALAMLFQQIMLLFFGGHYLSTPFLIGGFTEILGVKVLNQHLLTLGIVAVVIIFVWLLLSKTKLGMAIRATAQDAEVANLMGISVPRTLMLTMGIATALAAVAGIAVAPLWTIYPSMWTPPLMMVMVIVILGGLGNIKGSFIGAFIIALVEVLVVTLVPGGSFLKMVFALLVMVIVLTVRPGGMFGIVFEEERL
jgi:branched-chain amino acid transport system permease protein